MLHPPSRWSFIALLSIASCGAFDTNDDAIATRRPRAMPPSPSAAGTSSSASPSSPNASPPSAPPAPIDAVRIDGSITIRTGQEGTVFLGDGSRFLAKTDGKSPVVFTDPTLTGPQDVTFVTGVAAYINAFTLARVNRNDVWIGYRRAASNIRDYAKVRGNFLGIVSGAQVVRALGDVYHFGESLGGNAYELTVYSPVQSLDLVGLTTTASDVLYAGVRQGIVLPPAPVSASDPVPIVDSQDVVMTRAFDRSVTVTITNDASQGDVKSGVLFHYLRGGQPYFEAHKNPTNGSATFAAMALDAPFDGFLPFVSVNAPYDATGRAATVDMPFPKGEGTLSVTFPPPAPNLDAPAGVPLYAEGPEPGVAFAPGSRLEISKVAKEAQLVQAIISGPTATGTMEWYIDLPPTETSFTMFALPAAASPAPFITSTGTTVMHLMQSTFGDATTTRDVLGATPEALDALRIKYGRTIATLSRRMTLL